MVFIGRPKLEGHVKASWCISGDHKITFVLFAFEFVLEDKFVRILLVPLETSRGMYVFSVVFPSVRLSLHPLSVHPSICILSIHMSVYPSVFFWLEKFWAPQLFYPGYATVVLVTSTNFEGNQYYARLVILVISRKLLLQMPQNLANRFL